MKKNILEDIDFELLEKQIERIKNDPEAQERIAKELDKIEFLTDDSGCGVKKRRKNPFQKKVG